MYRYCYTLSILFVEVVTEVAYFVLCEVTPSASWKIFFGQAGKVNAIEFVNAIAKMLEYTTHDTVATRVDLYTHNGEIVFVYIADSICMDLPIFELYARSDLLHVLHRYGFIERYLIDFLLLVLGVHELCCQVTIVGKEEKTCGIPIETTNRIDTLVAGVTYQVYGCESFLGVAAGSYPLAGVFEQYLNILLDGQGRPIYRKKVL